jgi:glycosyltransferase involved in cell wall biosynthesis
MPMGRRHIAVYVPALIGGGAERVAALLASRLARAGHDVALVVDFEATENRKLVSGEVSLRTLGGGHAGSVARLARLMREQRFDVALAIGASANIKLVAARMISRTPTRLVLSYHGTSDAGRGWLGWSAYPLAGLLTRHAARTVCVSDYIVAHLVQGWRGCAKRTVRIYNPVPVGRAQPAASAAELAARSPSVIGVGRLDRNKDFANLIRAFAELQQRDARLTIYGEGKERAALQELAGRLGIAERTSLPGYVDDPWDAYAKASCLALCSRSEAFGNVVVEAMACGLPVVATDCGGPVEILGSGRFGEIVPVGEPRALAAAISRALECPGEPAPRIARAQEFATEKIVGNYLSLFEEVLADRTAALP